MNKAHVLFDETGLKETDYCVFGVATYFTRVDGDLKVVEIMEPIPSAALEALLKGIPTSYKLACAMTLGEVFCKDKVLPPRVLGDRLELPEDLLERTMAAAITYQRHPKATEHISLGSVYEKLNYSVDHKRILNQENIVRSEDNVKQHSHTHKTL